MSRPSGIASENGEYGEMRRKIAQVAAKALRAAAKASKVNMPKATESEKPVNTRDSEE